MKTEIVRKAFTSRLLELAHFDPHILAIATDSRGSVTLTDFSNELPHQFIECGIAEQNAVGIGAGLANGGFKPFVCGPACFISMRSAEQVKVDVAYSHSNVKIIGVSGGVSYGALGTTHHATQDIALMRSIPNIEIFLPADASQMIAMTDYLSQSTEPAYVRMGRGGVPNVYTSSKSAFTYGHANQLTQGDDVSIIACGEMVYNALIAAELLQSHGIQASVYDMHTLRPLDEATILKAADSRLVITVEEHCIHGGLGAAVAELLSQKKPTRMLILGLPDVPLHNGTSEQVLAHYNLLGDGIATAIITALEQ